MVQRAKSCRKTIIIDKTLPELFSAERTDPADLRHFGRLLVNLGVDVLEVDADIIKNLGEVPEGLDFIQSAETMEDLAICIGFGIGRVVVKPALLASSAAQRLIRGKGLFTILEVEADELSELSRYEENSGFTGLSLVNCIRPVGLCGTGSHLWFEMADIIRTLTGKGLDICPEYSMSMGNAILQEAFLNGMDFVTSTFTGYGRGRQYASTEILLAAVKLLHSDTYDFDLGALPEAKKLFEKLTLRDVPDNLPVVGKNIFRYESGIHADGIRNNPKTYEPYDPALVGLKRELVIGKHSGRQSISTKMSEFGMEAEKTDLSKLLERVRELSTELNRSLSDDELIKTYLQNGGTLWESRSSIQR